MRLGVFGGILRLSRSSINVNQIILESILQSWNALLVPSPIIWPRRNMFIRGGEGGRFGICARVSVSQASTRPTFFTHLDHFHCTRTTSVSSRTIFAVSMPPLTESESTFPVPRFPQYQGPNPLFRSRSPFHSIKVQLPHHLDPITRRLVQYPEINLRILGF